MSEQPASIVINGQPPNLLVVSNASMRLTRPSPGVLKIELVDEHGKAIYECSVLGFGPDVQSVNIGPLHVALDLTTN